MTKSRAGGRKGKGGNGKKWTSFQVRCPHPDCNHIGGMITKVHARTHGMERDELFAKYGEPKNVHYDTQKLKKNSEIRTILPNNAPVLANGTSTRTNNEGIR